MKRILLDSATPFFKGNMHCHSTVSDGALAPQELKELYRAHGYHFIAFTDHEHVENIQERLEAEILTQKSERQEYLLNLLIEIMMNLLKL